MKDLRLFFILLFMISYANGNAQKILQSDHYNYVVKKVFGDLNKDGLKDKVVITQDTIAHLSPYKLQIYFNQAGKFGKAQINNQQFIPPKYIYGKENQETLSSFANVEIVKGILIISFELIRGNYNYKFRYQNGNFELIGFTEVSADYGHIYYNDFNLSTGRRLRKAEELGSNKITARSTEKKLIRPLPKLQDIITNENDDYLR